jgi:aminoglycoside phosphotransferase (APT) family kinase protein
VTVDNVDDQVGRLQQRLVEAARRATGQPELHLRGALAEITGGYWAKTYGLAFDNAPPELDRPLVLRVMPDERHAAAEIAVQRTVAEQGYRAPAVRLADATAATLGRPYMLMDRADGQPLLANLTLGRALTTLPRILRDLPGILATTLIDLHRLDPTPVQNALAAAGAHDRLGGTNALLAALQHSRSITEVPSLHRAFDWLTSNQPPAQQGVVCHGDLHPLNLLANGTNVCAVIDWTGARVGDPAYDVASTAVLVAQAPLAAPAIVQPALRALGRSLARRFVTQYRAAMPLDTDQYRWHEAWQCLRALAEVADNRLGGNPNHGHPFETSAVGLGRQLQENTGIEVTLPPCPEH